MAAPNKPLVLITGIAGRLGTALVERLGEGYRIAGFDIEAEDGPVEVYACDLSSDESVAAAVKAFRRAHRGQVAAVIHLAAFFDFTGADDGRYQSVNVEGTKRLFEALKGLPIERLIYASTMLVHEPGEPGTLITEATPLAPRWAYPKSKAEAEKAAARAAGDTPLTILRFAGVYDRKVAVPTLAQQIARIYERDFEANLYPGDPKAGQSLLHMDDLTDAVALVLGRRSALPKRQALLIGEPGAASYAELQTRIAALIHGEESWPTLGLPKAIAKLGAQVQHQAEPLIPDSIDQGERPFIRPFMIAMTDDHYALDISAAGGALGWVPRHRILEELPGMIEELKADPLVWYEANRITPPGWMKEAQAAHRSPEKLRTGYEAHRIAQHTNWLWAHWAVMFLGALLISSPMALGHNETGVIISDIGSGVALLVLGFLSLDLRFSLVRFVTAALGAWIAFAPMVFWTSSAAAFLNGTIVGALVLCLALLPGPFPLSSPIAEESGPDVPPGWDSSPSTFAQRAPIIALAVIGFLISRYMTAYQLGHIDAMWDPFFAGSTADPRNGSEEIVTSAISRAWPVPDAGIGALTYLLEIVTGLMGSSRRWRTMPWLVMAFGLMIVPLGVVSITFIIIQPVLLGTWCTLCLIAAAAMVIQIPYSVDELVASGQFLARKRREKAFARALIFGDTDTGDKRDVDNFSQPVLRWLRGMGGGVSVPWTLALSVMIAALLMLSRLTVGSEGALANADHVIGALALVIAVTAMAEVTRAARLLNVALGIAAALMPVLLGGSLLQIAVGAVLGLGLAALSLPKGVIRGHYGSWDRRII
jgi:nucleoside-diphosphate-sugar epimerase/uncharacterized membrane protein